MTTVRLTVAAALVEFLRRQFIARDGVRHRLVHGVCGIFGHGNLTGFGQALAEYGGTDLPFYQPKSEQAMVHTAIAFAKARARLGTLACTTSVGPGATNMVTGAATATINRLPVLLLPGDVFATRIPSPVLQQLEHSSSPETSVNDCFRPVSRFWDRIQRPEQLLRSLPEAMRVLASPVETGAVTVCLPQDVQTEAYDWPRAFFAERVWEVPRPRADATAVATAARWLRESHSPFVIAGGGVHYSGAVESLRAFVDATGIPVGMTQAGMGALLDTHPCSMGGIGVTGTQAANVGARRADVIVAIGTRLSDFTTASKTLFEHPEVRFIAIQIHPGDAVKHAALPLVGDAAAVLSDLTTACAGWSTNDTYRADVASAKRAWDATRNQLVAAARPDAPLSQAEVIGVLNATLGANATIVHAAGGLPGDLHKLWRCRDARSYHAEYGYSCMGYEIAGALGVALACPDREVVALVGDGSYLMLHTELVTAVQEGHKILVVLLDNGGYQCIHGLQRANGGRSFGNEFRRRTTGELDGARVMVDYAANARSLGCEAWTVASRADLAPALAAARATPHPALVQVHVEAQPLPGFAWWDVPVAEVSSDSNVTAARRAYDIARQSQRYWGG